jgi:hypothetical protein
MKITRFIICFLLAAFILGGCATSSPNPLAGWSFKPFPGWGANHNGHNNNVLDKAITDDYQDFIAKNKLDLVGAITGFFEDGTEQHAIQFLASPPNQNAAWTYVLIYDKQNKRIKAMKYGYHGFRS